MLRTSITATAAVAALALLAACGPVQMGAAATVGSSGISAATLTSEVQHLNAAYQASKGRIQLQFPPGRESQAVLSWLVRFKVRDEIAVQRGIKVTTGESQRALTATEAQARQSGASLANLAVANGLPPDMLLALGRYEVIQAKLLRQLDGGQMPTSQAGLQTLSREFMRQQCLAAKSLHVSINPQFGTLDYTQLAVVPAASALSAPADVRPSPTAQPGPAC